MREKHVNTFYGILDELKVRLGGNRLICDCNGRIVWPQRGVYFFLEPGEVRSDHSPRVVRVGTHALKRSSNSTLWRRIAQHKGTSQGTGNHRGSIYRLLIGAALMARSPEIGTPTWGKGSSARPDVTELEKPLESQVSAYLAKQPILWLAIDDEPSPNSLRGYIERNAIALLSNCNKQPIDPPSSKWLGHSCPRDPVKKSGLWNNNHVTESYDLSFLDTMQSLVSKV